MTTTTIEATPESVAAFVASLPPEDRARFDAALQNFAPALNVPNDYRLTDEDKASLAQSADEDDAGLFITAEESDALILAEFGWAKKK